MRDLKKVCATPEATSLAHVQRLLTLVRSPASPIRNTQNRKAGRCFEKYYETIDVSPGHLSCVGSSIGSVCAVLPYSSVLPKPQHVMVESLGR